MAINFKRFFKRLEDINNLKNTSFEKIDINKIALTLDDKIARDKIIKWMKNLNLTIKIDNIGNIFVFIILRKILNLFYLAHTLILLEMQEDLMDH